MAKAIAQKTDFVAGAVWKRIVEQAIPITVAQLVHLLYNVIDRIYLGHMQEGEGLALTGVGVTFPIITLIMAFTALFGMGGVPLFSIARGAGDSNQAKKILHNSFLLLFFSSFFLMVLGYAFRKPILFAFGASEASFVYANDYLKIYLAGTVFSMLSTGLNGYINAQGFPKIGMRAVLAGSIVNIALDPIFIFVFDWGVSGAALATVIGQAISSLCVLSFLFGKKAPIGLRVKEMSLSPPIVKQILSLGTSNFIMQGTNCLVQVACNSTLQAYGGDLYIGIMTVTNSVREICMLPVSGLISGAQPVISFNYGAQNYARVRYGIRFNTWVGSVYTLLVWLFILLFPQIWFSVFSGDPQLSEAGVEMLKIYFFGFVFMALQFAGQSTFQAVGDAKHAIFFSLLRKAFIVVPLTFLLPAIGFGVKGVFLAEPISNAVGGLASYLTMRLTVYRKLSRNL